MRHPQAEFVRAQRDRFGACSYVERADGGELYACDLWKGHPTKHTFWEQTLVDVDKLKNHAP